MPIRSLTKYFILSFITAFRLSGQVVDSTSITINTRLSFYSNERSGELLVRIPAPLIGTKLNILIRSGDTLLSDWGGNSSGNYLKVPFTIKSSLPAGEINAEIVNPGAPGIQYTATCLLEILPHKANEVKTDRLTGGLIVNGLPFFPFGFYCYTPVHPTLPEEEVVKGFNMISPYQKVLPETFEQRKAYMDRCAMLGMKVNYNLLSVSGGGGVNSKLDGYTDEQKRELLEKEIKAFMDHPALLAWYIADEPTGNKVPPETIEEIYRFVKHTDPWHPVSVVFMTPFSSARKYSKGVDIVMADPYPIPDYPVTMTGDATEVLMKDFSGKNPVWIVPQAFGGGELWKREPTIPEVRVMTWLAIIKGATGVQYFVRHGLNSFPKSTATWGECGKMALEITSIAPWLLSDEKTIPVRSGLKNIIVTSKMHRGRLLILAVNTRNEPVMADFTISKIINGKVRVLFENRELNAYGGIFSDHIPAYGAQAYRIDIDPVAAKVRQWTGNMLIDPGFEDITHPGIPSACYARPGADRGATYFLDPRISLEGYNSLRLTTPEENKGVTIRFFPVKVRAGSSYMISIWAKAGPDQGSGYKDSVGSAKQSPQYAEAGLYEFGMARFIPGKEWKQFVTFVTIPSDTLPEIKANVILRLPGQGVAWFDMLQVIEDPLSIKK